MTGKCKEKVMRGWQIGNCSRNAWKDGYCKQHHPLTIKERERKQKEKYDKEWENSPIRRLKRANEKIQMLESELSEVKQVEKQYETQNVRLIKENARLKREIE